jgi:adenylylsulfate kinase-like enzyme
VSSKPKSWTTSVQKILVPFEADRIRAREIIGADDFHEIHIAASLQACIQRDTKGLYKKALNGEIRDFTGSSDPFSSRMSASGSSVFQMRSKESGSRQTK